MEEKKNKDTKRKDEEKEEVRGCLRWSQVEK